MTAKSHFAKYQPSVRTARFMSVSYPKGRLQMGFGPQHLTATQPTADETRAVTKTFEMMQRLAPNLQGKVLGLVGFGRVAQRVAAMAALRFDMTLIVADPSEIPGPICEALNVERVSLDALMATSDVVSLHCWNAADTKGLISGPQLDLMQDHAVLIDTVGEGVVDRQALFHALSFDMLAGAGVDIARDRSPAAADLEHCDTCLMLRD